jgi:hypothetical protein
MSDPRHFWAESKESLGLCPGKPLDPGWTDIPHSIVWNVKSNGQSNCQSRTRAATLSILGTLISPTKLGTFSVNLGTRTSVYFGTYNLNNKAVTNFRPVHI